MKREELASKSDRELGQPGIVPQVGRSAEEWPPRGELAELVMRTFPAPPGDPRPRVPPTDRVRYAAAIIDEMREAIKRLPMPPEEMGDGPDERVVYALQAMEKRRAGHILRIQREGHAPLAVTLPPDRMFRLTLARGQHARIEIGAESVLVEDECVVEVMT